MKTWHLSPNYRPVRFLYAIYGIEEICYTDKSVISPFSFPRDIEPYPMSPHLSLIIA